jgi:hypothetical protein
MNNLLLILLSTQYDREQVIKSLEADGKIDTWFYSFPNTIFVKTDLNSKQMSLYIQEKFGEHMNFVTDIEDDYFGRMTAGQWEKFKPVKKFN